MDKINLSMSMYVHRMYLSIFTKPYLYMKANMYFQCTVIHAYTQVSIVYQWI